MVLAMELSYVSTLLNWVDAAERSLLLKFPEPKPLAAIVSAEQHQLAPGASAKSREVLFSLRSAV